MGGSTVALVVSLLAVGLASGVAPVASASGPDVSDAPTTTGETQAVDPAVEEVEQCVRRNLPEKTSVQSVKLRSVDRIGGERTLAGKFYWKRFPGDRSRILIRIEAPPDVRGSSYLMLDRDEKEPELFVYLPELKRVRRVTSHAMAGSLFGTDFSYEDFRRLQRLARDAGSERLPDAELQGRPVYALRIKPPPQESSGYERIDVFVDRATCVLLRSEFYERGEKMRKLMTVDPGDIGREGTLWVPRAVQIRDLRNETETRLEVERVQIDPELPDRLFTTGLLARGH